MRFVTTSASILLLCAGCREGLPVAPVSGTITYRGEPLADANITTQPIATDSMNPGPGSFGRTDGQGRFELELVKPAIKGAIIGEHRVMISPAGGDTTHDQPQRSADGKSVYWTDDPLAHRKAVADLSWPPRFADGSLRLQVPPEGKADARFDLTQ
ncbi:MAG: carboxypeptidase-like regulatory domain-containing protein [Planctomycetes bacterium]|nr:carboxypeptidase-like regulatory domain-containing protein [Planctomycetota bacterium]